MQTNKRNKSIIVWCISIIILLALLTTGWLTYAYRQHTWPYSSPQSDNTSDSTINYSSPTNQEVDEGQDAKRRASDSATNDGAPPSDASKDSKRSVSVGVSYAGVVDNKLEVRAFVDGVIEGNGTCTAIMTNGSQSLSKSAPAFIDASSSICEPIQQDTSGLTPGQWQVTVKYTSPDAQGISDKVMVTI